VAIAAVISLLATSSLTASATASDLKKIRCTCYCEGGVTKSGHYTNDHVIAGRNEDLYNVAAIYAIGKDGELGEFIGYFDFYDTGAGIDTDGDGKGDTIRTGKSVDVFRNSYADAKNGSRHMETMSISRS
jgi:hypothetical protein